MRARRILGLIGTLAACTVLGLGADAWAQGVRAYVVRTGSMTPTLRPGDLVVDEPAAAGAPLRVGDIITFHPQPETTETHRVHAIVGAGIVTKGDANRTPDVGEIQPSMISGRVALTVPYGGYAAVFFQQPTGIAALILFFIAVRLAWDLLSPPAEPPAGRALRLIPAAEAGLAWPSGPLPPAVAPRSIGARPIGDRGGPRRRPS